MSLIGSALKGITGIAKSVYGAIKPYTGAILGGAVGGPAGAAIGQQIFGGGGTPGLPALPGGSPRLSGPATGFPGLGMASKAMSTQQLVMTGGYSRSRISQINRAAGAMCARFPAWCLQVGGVGTVAQAMATGQLPIPRRRRGKGITARDLRSFKRVANLVRHFSAPVHRMRHTTTRRRT